MKKKDMLLVLSILAVAFICLVLFRIQGDNRENAVLRITVDGEVYGQYSLEEEQVIPINDTNTCEIKDGKVTMISANCPDHLCEHQRAIGVGGGSIVCLPNKVVLDIVEDEAETKYDVISN